MTTERSGMSLELAHCPFCGRIPEVVDQDGIAWVECRGCNCEGPDDETAELAVEKWNSRYPSPPSDHLSRDAVVPDAKPLPDLMLASYHEAVGWNACRKAMLAQRDGGAE